MTPIRLGGLQNDLIVSKTMPNDSQKMSKVWNGMRHHCWLSRIVFNSHILPEQCQEAEHGYYDNSAEVYIGGADKELLAFGKVHRDSEENTEVSIEMI